MVVGVFEGDFYDIVDGFIYFLAVVQVEGILFKYYNQYECLVLVEIDLEQLGEIVKWEVLCGGDLFLYVYGMILVSVVKGVCLIGCNEEGGWIMLNDLEGSC